MNNVVNIVAYTIESTDTDKMNENMTIFSGKAAGVCYMPDDYLSNGIQNTEKAIKRAESNAKSGHHSVYDHAHISFMVNTSKMMAMVLNSLGVYATSEKSARYTKMHPETKLELELYEKWTKIIREKILYKYPWLDDKLILSRLKKKIENIDEFNGLNIKVIGGTVITNDISKSEKLLEIVNTEIIDSDTLPSAKLATENARYMISVFTPTTMMYTVSFRQAMLIIIYLKKLAEDCKKNSSIFYSKLSKNAIELADSFENAIGTMRIKDIKNQNIRLFGTCDENAPDIKQEYLGDSYTLNYKASLACLAQLQRHRTIRYSMFMGKIENMTFYVPTIVKEYNLTDEWLKDIKSVSYCVPQGTLVDITEQGIFEDFALKCKERLCGRAQLEITRNTAESVIKFYKNSENLSICNKKLLYGMVNTDSNGNTKVCARCEFPDFKCVEGCTWGRGEYLTRLI